MLKNVDRYLELSQKVQKHLDLRGTELETILKGHLLVEDLLYKALVASSKNGSLIKQASLSFHKLALIVQALHEDKCEDWIWKSIIKLNQIRNKIAHNLEYPQVEEILESFVKDIEISNRWSKELDDFYNAKALPSRISFLCVRLMLLIDEIEN